MNSPLFLGQDIKVQLVRGGKRVIAATPADVNRFVKRGFAVSAMNNAVGGNFAIGGTFKVECFRADGTKRWTKHVKNGIVNQGLNKLLNVMFQGATQITTWYLDLINTGATLAASDVYATHAGWTYSSAYSNATRPTWAPAASTAQSSTNTSTVDFTINGTATINGIAVVAGSSTKGDVASGSGVLWATGSFPGGEQPVVNGDTLKVTYTVNASAA
jgi:hypothetical protein